MNLFKRKPKPPPEPDPYEKYRWQVIDGYGYYPDGSKRVNMKSGDIEKFVRGPSFDLFGSYPAVWRWIGRVDDPIMQMETWHKPTIILSGSKEEK